VAWIFLCHLGYPLADRRSQAKRMTDIWYSSGIPQVRSTQLLFFFLISTFWFGFADVIWHAAGSVHCIRPQSLLGHTPPHQLALPCLPVDCATDKRSRVRTGWIRAFDPGLVGTRPHRRRLSRLPADTQLRSLAFSGTEQGVWGLGCRAEV
jgi:hypothetical protein